MSKYAMATQSNKNINNIWPQTPTSNCPKTSMMFNHYLGQITLVGTFATQMGVPG